MAILAVVGALVVCTALGAAVALNAATGTDGPAAAEVAAAPQECRGQAGCSNEYSVALSCGGNDEPRAVSVQAADREAAERKAERYNRDCRSNGAVFVAGLIRTAANTAFRGPQAHANRNAEHNTTTASSNSTASGRRSWRFRRR